MVSKLSSSLESDDAFKSGSQCREEKNAFSLLFLLEFCFLALKCLE